MRLIDANAMRDDWLENGENEYVYDTNAVLDSIDSQPTVDAVEVVRHGRWEWFEEWSQSTPGHPAEYEDYGWRCSECKTALEDIVGGYWDDLDREPMLNYCPKCGAKNKPGG